MRDLQEVVDNPASVIPVRNRYGWVAVALRYGVIDSTPSVARSRFPARLPKPPCLPAMDVQCGQGDHA